MGSLGRGMTMPTASDRLARALQEREALIKATTLLEQTVSEMQAERDRALELATSISAERGDLVVLLREVRQSGVEHDAPGYVTVQIDRQTWADLAAVLEGRDE